MSQMHVKDLQQHLVDGKGLREPAGRIRHSLHHSIKNKILRTLLKSMQNSNIQGKTTRNKVSQPPCHPAMGHCVLGWHHHFPSAEDRKNLLKAREAR